MLDELLTKVEQYCSTITAIRLGSARIDRTRETDLHTVQFGLFLWYGMLLDVASRTLDESSFSSFKGRVLNDLAVWKESDRDLYRFLSMLDELASRLLKEISSDAVHFKGGGLYNEFRAICSDFSPEFTVMYSPVLKSLCLRMEEYDPYRAISDLLQSFTLLKKIRIDRSDLRFDYDIAFFEKELLLHSEETYQRRREPAYDSLVYHARGALADFVDGFTIGNFRPKHGPGAVSDPAVTTWTGKYLSLRHDERVDYQLRKSGLAPYEAYAGEIRSSGSRTSRFICVPKTWKSLRGISAEPPELQYFQQGLFHAIDRCIKRSSFSQYIDLSDQQSSRQMACKGSSDMTLATIDLSEASDSVTTQIVKDFFGPSELLRWVLATRSTHTMCGKHKLKIRKYAPMGSACCFPIECLIFLAVVLATARQLLVPVDELHQTVRVFGDDIIVPSFLATAVMDNLDVAGFSVNTDKSYTSGRFRESCGEVAWNGHSIIPLRYKSVDGFYRDHSLSYEAHSQLTSILNSLEWRGYHSVRSYLLHSSLSRNVKVGRQNFSAKNAFSFSYSGGNSSIASTHPTNFHLKRKFRPSLWASVYQMVKWVDNKNKEKYSNEYFQRYLYLDWLLSQEEANSNPVPVVYDLSFFKNLDTKFKRSDERKRVMIPTVKWVSLNHLD